MAPDDPDSGSFLEPEKLGRTFRDFFVEHQECWDLFKLTWLLKDNPSVTRCSMQNCNELAQMLIFLYSRREQIDYYAELGVRKCGTFYVVDQCLRAFAPNYKFGIAIDSWAPSFDRFGLERYREIYPESMLLLEDLRTIDFETLPRNVFFFIDCEHTYEMTMGVFNKIRDRASYVVFDDVANPRYPEMERVWNEIGINYETRLWQTLDPRLTHGNGLGLVMNLNQDQS